VDFLLSEGNYRIALNTQGVDVLGGYNLTASDVKVLDYSDPIDAEGELTGNVIEDLNINAGIDTVTATTTVKSVEFGGQVYDINNTSGQDTVIVGKYGTLTINSQGEYTYEIDGDKFDASTDFDKTEVFTYTIEDTANPSFRESSADLSIQLVDEISEPVIVADTVVMTLSEPTVGPSADVIDPITNVDMVGIALGPVLNVDVLPDIDQTMTISVKEDTLRTVTFKASGGGLAIGGTQADLLIYREDESTGKYVLVHTEEDWYTVIGIILAIGRSDALELTLPPGEYIAVLQSDSIGINLGTGVTLSVIEDETADYSGLTASGVKTGNIDADMTELLAFEGTLFGGATSQEIIGEYGTLLVNTDGSYVYTLNDFLATDEKPYGEMESFSYTFEKDGNISKGRLNLKIDGAEITDDTITSDSLTGNLFANDIVADSAADADRGEYWSEMVINGEQMYVQGTLGNDSVEITLKSGTLTVMSNGDYTFVADGASTEPATIDYTLTSLFGETYQGSIDIIPEPPVAMTALSFERFDYTESTDSMDDGSDESDIPNLDSLVDTSKSLSYGNEPIAGSSVPTEPVVDSYVPLTTPENYLEEDTASSSSLV
jgi:VCBS repeat-containing protein